MTDLELDALAEGIFKYIIENTESPIDGVAIIGMALLKIYTAAGASIPIQTFADDFRASLIGSYNARSVEGTETRQ